MSSATGAGDAVLIERADGVVTLRLNRPASLNALSRAMVERLREALRDLAHDREAGAVLLTGTGRAFCAGADLNDPMMGRDLAPAARSDNTRKVLGELLHGLIRELHALPLPTVAAVNGIAAGGGVGLALACRITLAAHSARFLLPFTPRMAMVPDLGCTWQLARRLGPARAQALALLGEELPAQTAADWGLIWQAVPDEGLPGAAAALAARLRDGPRRAQRALCGLLDGALARDLPAQLAHECEAQAALAASDDAAEAMAAFAQKRPPRFTGR